jgi:NitT/TauT family transport system permease protein
LWAVRRGARRRRGASWSGSSASASLKIAGGLPLIGVIVADFAAGTAGIGSGLADRILEGGLPAQHSTHVRCLVLISLTGILTFMALT